jgi:transcriptional regulator with XRE-family HTH domain
MSTKQLFEKLTAMEVPQTDEPLVPPPELIGFFVRWVRSLKNWKQSTLAEFAQVSISTIERIERGEKVSDDCLESIGRAFGYEPGYFTAPRRRKSAEDAMAEFVETWGNLEAVEVRALRTQPQVRNLAGCHAYLVHRPDVDHSYDPDIAALTEWLDLACFIIESPFEGEDSGEGGRRELYKSILACVRRIEQRGVTVLAGVMPAPQDGIPDWRVAIISVTPKATDPGALKRRAIFVDRRCVALPTVKAA